MYLFFIRHFNDVDHTTPVVWQMVESGYDCAVYCLNPRYDIQSDYRLKFLTDIGVPVNAIYNRCLSAPPGCRILTSLFSLCYAAAIKMEAQAGLGWMARAIGKLGDRIFSMALKRYFDRRWALDFIRMTQAKVLCFDWVKPGNTVVGALLESARAQGVPTLSLPHGVFVYTNPDISIESRPLRTFDKLDRYDAVIVQNARFKEFMADSGLARGRIHVLGSARYSSAWIERNRRILPRQIGGRNGSRGRLKVTLMTTKLRYRVDAGGLIRTIERLADMDGVDLAIKPHTRSGNEVDIFRGVEANLWEDVSSVELCEWADVVLVIASSIMLEALIQGKPVLYLKYLHANTTIYEDRGACWPIHGDDELMAALSAIRDGRATLPYSTASAQEFIDDVVYRGESGSDILQLYVDFITRAAS